MTGLLRSLRISRGGSSSSELPWRQVYEGSLAHLMESGPKQQKEMASHAFDYNRARNAPRAGKDAEIRGVMEPKCHVWILNRMLFHLARCILPP